MGPQVMPAAPAPKDGASEAIDPAMLRGPVVLFDGVCNLCRSSVQFVLARDPQERFRFASLQSPTGARLAAHFGIAADALETMVLIVDGTAHTRSGAALRIAKRLSAPWPLLSALLIVPRHLRDAVYLFIGRRRYRWFGKMETCWLPEPRLRDRFLD